MGGEVGRRPTEPSVPGREVQQPQRVRWRNTGLRALRRAAGAPLTIVLSLIALAVSRSPAAMTWLEFDRVAVATGQWWRLLSGHLTHWNGEHVLWNVGVFLALGALCERIDRRRFAACLLGSALVIPAVVWIASPEILVYRGLSGIDSALFILVAVTVLRTQWASRDWLWVLLAAGLLIAFVVKTGYEQATGGTLFVNSAAAGFIVIPAAHTAGAAVGAIVGLAGRRVLPERAQCSLRPQPKGDRCAGGGGIPPLQPPPPGAASR